MIGNNKNGNVLLAQGQRDAAVAIYRDGLAISRAVGEQDKRDTQWQIDVVALLIASR